MAGKIVWALIGYGGLERRALCLVLVTGLGAWARRGDTVSKIAANGSK